VGKNIHFAHKFTEAAKNYDIDEQLDFSIIMADPIFKQIRNEFENRLNKMYTHPLLADLLDTNEIDFAVLNICEEVLKYQNEDKIYFNETSDTHTGKIFQAALDLNIIYRSKYYGNFNIDHALYYEHVLNDYIAKI